jgi:hypothetical protein
MYTEWLNECLEWGYSDRVRDHNKETKESFLIDLAKKVKKVLDGKKIKQHHAPRTETWRGEPTTSSEAQKQTTG